MPDIPDTTSPRAGTAIEALFKVALTALVGFMGWQQKSMTDEIAAARDERQEERKESREERERLMVWALGVSKQTEKTAAVVSDVRKDVGVVKKAVEKLEP